MKIKPALLYPLLLLVLGTAVVIYTQMSKVEPAASVNNSSTMPNDDIHKALPPAGDAPSKNNVNESYTSQVNTLREKIAKSAKDTLSMRLLAELLFAGHKEEEAAGLYNKILSINPNRIDILFALTQYYYNKTNFTEAEKLTNKVLSIDKSNLQAMYNLGAIAATQGNKEKAKLQWNMIVEKYPDSETAQLAREGLKKL